MLVAHLSDLHLDPARPETLDRARRVVDHVRALDPRPDLNLASGDITDHGTDEEYAHAAELFAGLDVRMLPGNHDRRPAMRTMLGLPRTDEPITSIHPIGAVTLVLADSHVPDHDHGELAPESRDAIAEAAARPGVLVVALHHPPMPIGSRLLDPIRLLDPEPLLGPLRGRGHPSVVLCGHAHTPLATTVDGIPVRIAPGVVSTLRLPCEPQPDTADRGAPPGFALHVLDERTGDLATHVRTLAT
ncbi:metallophosphoesterase [Actinomycetospora sp. NBRC 106378]|uniref:metallophosphoesterase n=1 Tax=Actinomycetospora sp. NBRC 106378 TaxID=3032208 RepID=UPI0024A4B034|nr:metallophosphoesterase [Actinomycetospora sp. NBRC 106378]GLZ53019.1 3',5'-cyclic adenosine monophosphate phosphodiesterase CpdA [Actinomycetospora sp. NBRC 106378]